MMCQCGFVLGEKCTILLSDVNNGEGYACIGGKVISYSSVLSSQFYCKPKQIKS